ncbi:MAG: glycosyltransferase, partial [Verrucomicrobiota bacterium]
DRLPTPPIRKDLIRLVLLYLEGGVYLDLDTVTVGSLQALCADTEAFCGEERIVFPGTVRHSLNPAVQLLALLRNGARDVLGYVPRGWQIFRMVERFYPRAANGAVLASVPRGRFVTRALERLSELPPHVQTRTCGIGPHLIQELTQSFGSPDLDVHPPAVFYPLGPELSRHWFYLRGGQVSLARVLLPETRVVHWYGSVGNQKLTSAIDPAYVRANAGRQLFSRLALPFAEA